MPNEINMFFYPVVVWRKIFGLLSCCHLTENLWVFWQKKTYLFIRIFFLDYFFRWRSSPGGRLRGGSRLVTIFDTSRTLPIIGQIHSDETIDAVVGDASGMSDFFAKFAFHESTSSRRTTGKKNERYFYYFMQGRGRGQLIHPP